jgi:hypothetical protein
MRPLRGANIGFADVLGFTFGMTGVAERLRRVRRQDILARGSGGNGARNGQSASERWVGGFSW